jgi:RHS repeat-associated protein
MKKIIFSVLLSLVYTLSHATINGPSLVLQGSTITYTRSPAVSNPNWQVTGGTISTSTSTSVTVVWGSTTTFGNILYLSGTTPVDGYGQNFTLPPVAAAASNITYNSFKANWNIPIGANSYTLYVSTSSTFGTLLPGYPVTVTPGATNYATVSGLSPISTYYYRVTATSSAGTTAVSNTITVTTPTGILPNAPTNIATIIAVNNSIKISWTDNSTNEDAFEVDRSVNGAAYSKIVTLSVNNNQYFDINLIPGNTYTYRVRAINASGNSAYVTGSGVGITSNTAYTSSSYNKNSIQTISYGENGTVVGQSIAFSDNLGKGTQTIARSVSDGRVLANQTYYDNYGRPLVSSLTVPVNQTSLNYIPSFAVTGTTDLETFALNETSVNNLAISASCPLGQYYSTSSMEGFTPTDSYPYTAVQYSNVHPGTVRKAALAGQDHRLGQAHETQSYSMPVTRKELERFTTTDLIDAGIELDGLIKSISINPDGKEGITYSTSDGKLVSSCISNSPNPTDVKAILFTIDDIRNVNCYYDIHIPKGCSANTFKLYSNSPYGASFMFGVIDLTTGSVVPNYNYNNYIGNDPTKNWTLGPGLFRLVFQPPPAGTYNVCIGYNINYYNHSINVYDRSGRLLKSYSPKAVTAKTPSMVTTYEYNSLGQLLATTSPDEGRTEFKYRTDGKIRYSQNAIQKANETAVNGNGYFSYTNYDAAGRTVSVGEYKSGSNRFASLTGNETLSGTYTHEINTEYDTKTVSLPVGGYEQHFILGKVSKTSNANCTTWYSYTYDGRIEWIMQQFAGFGTKTIDYTYDFNGNVVSAVYQRYNSAERFDHDYVYDADGRLSLVVTKDYTSDGKVNQQKQQAKYIYYADGALKRVELADKLQGIDYVYTINGWLKSINNPKMVIAEDPGADNPSGNQFGQDVFAMSLDYFYNDYSRSGKTIGSSAPSGTNNFGGLIYAQRWNTNQIDKTGTAPSSTHSMYKYEYTNENWLGKATFGTYNSTAFTPDVGNIYKVYGLSGTTEINIPYDANGNILGMAQNGSTTTNLLMDKLTYNYIANKNQLGYVTDAVTSENYPDDIPNQASGNYTYDVIGRMTGNLSDLQYFDYDVYGQVTKIYKNSGKTQILSEYTYDDKGFRIKKIDRRNTPAQVTWYIRDGNGHILASYTAPEGSTPVRSEVELYGSSRLGTAQVVNGVITKFLYELTDQLGNVRAVVAADGTDANTYPDLAAYTDYYPFGMPMPDRVWTSGLLSGAYRFGYQGQFAEKDPETGYNQFEARLYDSRIGRWMIPDPAGQYWSPYLGMGNNWVSGVDPKGTEYSPIVDKNGNILGTDSEGWHGSILVFEDASKFTQGMSHSEALKIGHVFDFYKSNMTYEAQVNTVSNVISGTELPNATILKRTDFELSLYKRGPHAEYIDFNYQTKKHIIDFNFEYEWTVDNIRIVTIHEIYGHGIMRWRTGLTLGQGNHWKCYNAEINSKYWKYATPKLKSNIAYWARYYYYYEVNKQNFELPNRFDDLYIKYHIE